MNAKEAVNALSNLRPQHLTDALLVSPIQEQSGFSDMCAASFIRRNQILVHKPRQAFE